MIKCLPGGRRHGWPENAKHLDTAVQHGKKHQIWETKGVVSCLADLSRQSQGPFHFSGPEEDLRTAKGPSRLGEDGQRKLLGKCSSPVKEELESLESFGFRSFGD